MANLVGSDVRCVLWLSLFFFRLHQPVRCSGPRDLELLLRPSSLVFTRVPLGGVEALLRSLIRRLFRRKRPLRR